jgi:hypothetical protein
LGGAGRDVRRGKGFEAKGAAARAPARMEWVCVCGRTDVAAFVCHCCCCDLLCACPLRLDLRDIRVICKIGGTIDDSELVEGCVFDQKVCDATGTAARPSVPSPQPHATRLLCACAGTHAQPRLAHTRAGADARSLCASPHRLPRLPAAPRVSRRPRLGSSSSTYRRQRQTLRTRSSSATTHRCV